MSQITGGEVLARALKAVGVDTIFFLVGGPTQSLIEECIRIGIRLVDVRHEQAAAMMAHAYSRVTGKVGVCLTTSGPAVVNAATGVAVAFDDCAPVIVIACSVSLASRGTGAFEEMDQVGLMRPITKQAWQVTQAERISEFVAMAFRHAKANRPGPIYLDFPGDVLLAEVDEDQVKLNTLPSNVRRPAGDERLVEEAIGILEKAERPVVIAGSGTLWSGAGGDLQEFVECSQIPFFTTPLARGLIPEDHPLCFPYTRSFAWKIADAVLLVGSRNNFIVHYMRPPRFAADLKLIMVNIDAEEIGHNRPVDVGIVGDAKAILRQLTDRAGGRFAKSNSQKAWVEKLKEVNLEKAEKTEPLLNSDEKPIHPLRLCKEVREFLPRDAILAVDGNMIMAFARQSIPTYYPGHRLNPGVSGCMGVAVPFGIGAKVAKPETPVLVLTGDGSFGMNGMEMDTAVRHKINVVVVVSTNGTWSGVPSRYVTGVNIGRTRYDKIVEILGGSGYHVEDPQDIRPALENAFASGKPALVNVITSSVRATYVPFGSTAMDDYI
jgi:acetolactate synthase-1/2/3 large subunit